MDIFGFNKSEKLPPMVKAIEKYETFSVVKLTGDIDFNTMPSVEGVMREHRGHGHFDQDIVLDFKDVTHIDTSTLAVLIYIINKMRQGQKKLSLIHCSNPVKEYIKIGKLESVIHIYDRLEDVLSKAHE